MVELFSKVKEGPQADNIVKNCHIPFWKSGKLYRLEAVKDLHTLHLLWTLPCLKKEYLKKPEDYICHLLGHGYYPPFVLIIIAFYKLFEVLRKTHCTLYIRVMICLLIFLEGKGSILYLLKEKGWTTFLSAGIGQEGTQRSSLAYVLNTCIHLTDEGLEKVHLAIYF